MGGRGTRRAAAWRCRDRRLEFGHVSDIEYPENLLELARNSWQEIQRGELTVDTAHAVHAAVGAYAAEAGLPRYDVEMGLKRAVRHPAEA